MSENKATPAGFPLDEADLSRMRMLERDATRLLDEMARIVAARLGVSESAVSAYTIRKRTSTSPFEFGIGGGDEASSAARGIRIHMGLYFDPPGI